jgi:uncharacterized protein YjbI with pentapeptide repeats
MMDTARLRSADLRDTIHYGTGLRRADLQGADLCGAVFVNVDLREANLGSVKLQGLRYDPHTRWPTGFNPRRYGAVRQRS